MAPPKLAAVLSVNATPLAASVPPLLSIAPPRVLARLVLRPVSGVWGRVSPLVGTRAADVGRFGRERGLRHGREPEVVDGPAAKACGVPCEAGAGGDGEAGPRPVLDGAAKVGRVAGRGPAAPKR